MQYKKLLKKILNQLLKHSDKINISLSKDNIKFFLSLFPIDFPTTSTKFVVFLFENINKYLYIIQKNIYAKILNMSFQKKYYDILNIVQNEIEQVCENLTSDINIKEPLNKKLSNILNAPSKHIRPLISFLYLKALNLNIDEKQIILQTAIELVHNASLIHDDVIDDSEIRRNTKTINKDFDNKLAVISGDYILSIALNYIAKLNSMKIIEMFAETLSVMTKGEINQQFSRFQIPTINDYIKKTEQKTAKLFETALCGSLFLANSDKNACEFAKNFGIAFQIRDDIINIKTTQTDIKDGIYTAPIIYAGNIENYQNGIEKTRILLNNYIDNAHQNIEYIENNKYKTAIIELLGLLKNE